MPPRPACPSCRGGGVPAAAAAAAAARRRHVLETWTSGAPPAGSGPSPASPPGPPRMTPPRGRPRWLLGSARVRLAGCASRCLTLRERHMPSSLLPPPCHLPHTVCAVYPTPPEVRARVLRACPAPPEPDPSRPGRAPPIHCCAPRVYHTGHSPREPSPLPHCPAARVPCPARQPPRCRCSAAASRGGGARRRGRAVRSGRRAGPRRSSGGRRGVGRARGWRARALQAKREWRFCMRAHMLAYVRSMHRARTEPSLDAPLLCTSARAPPAPTHPRASRPAWTAPPSAEQRAAVCARRHPQGFW
jgi:hypothetical protein